MIDKGRKITKKLRIAKFKLDISVRVRMTGLDPHLMIRKVKNKSV